ncbi:protein phyllopod [Bradysia coprophila]|uniref:protein phyllopod n=1 Tax=Bradysia coprophila TaxID=38358 RepID=UPI00187D79A0|nr:protein phyllopod [Bradysia coprophila]
MSSESPRKKRLTCLICGSYTASMLNIYEPRCGPNIVEIIKQKFELELSDEDSPQYLCYQCNNWLINWHSLQNINDGSSSSSKSGKNVRFNQSIPEEHQQEQEQETMAVLVDQYSDVLRLRSNLSKYFYYPKKTNFNYPESAILRTKCSVYSRENRIKAARQRYRSFRSRFINRKCFRYGHQRKQTVRAYVNKSSNSRLRMKRKSSSHSQRRMVEHRSSQTIVINPYVVSRLKKLGTTVIREGTSATAANDLSRSITKKIDRSVIRSNSDDILIAFNTVLQEVFPVDISEKEDVVVVDDFSKIFERIPKSLSITLA